MFSHRYRYLFVLLLSAYTYLNTVLCEVYFYFKIETTWYYAFATILLVTLLIWEGNRLAGPLLRKRFTPERGRTRYLAAYFIAGNGIAVAATFFTLWLIGMVLMGLPAKAQVIPLKLNLIYATLVNLFFHLINAIIFFFGEYRKKWVEAEELRRASVQAQLQLIKSQVNPHFLFNNLNVLSSLVMRDNPEANKFIEEFSKVYRYILNNQEKELVALRSEMDFIQPYIFLLQKRFPGGLEVSLDVPERYKDYYIIPAALQMLIENAIKHNVVSRTKPLHIAVYVNGSNTLTIKNNLQPKQSEEPSTQIGLVNIKKRYAMISGQEVRINRRSDSFVVELPLLSLN